MINTRLFLLPLFFLFSCSVLRPPTADIHSLKYINTYEVPYNLHFNNTVVGGLSGIDYDKKNDLYYLICDDRSDSNLARFYTARIQISPSGISNVSFENVVTLLNKEGRAFSSSRTDKQHSADPEGIRYYPKTGELVWTSEGERVVKKDTILQDPSITIIDKKGRYVDTFALPAQTRMYAVEKGLRQNGVFEGLSFGDKYNWLYVNVEEPMYDDGPRAGLKDADAFIRIIKYSVKHRKPVSQYSYRLEPVAHPPKVENEFIINGVPDILYLGNNKLLVMERSFSTGIDPSTIRLFIVDLSGATDISSISSLRDHPVKPLNKKLLLNMDSLGIYTDNIEGVTFGPLLPNGHQSLLFVSDNNFSKKQKTQFYLFEVL